MRIWFTEIGEPMPIEKDVRHAFHLFVIRTARRDETEWIELVDARWNRLAPPKDSKALRATSFSTLGSHGNDIQPYGKGDAAQRIVQHLVKI